MKVLAENKTAYFLRQYKPVYILVTAIITAIVLSKYAILLKGYIQIEYDWWFELCVVFGQILFQWIFIFKKGWELKMEYAFNLLAVSTLGAIVLTPVLLINKFYAVTNIAALGYFFIVVGFMFLEHRRRVNSLELPTFICYTWILYRLIILVCII